MKSLMAPPDRFLMIFCLMDPTINLMTARFDG
jgi:hypothetical protein